MSSAVLRHASADRTRSLSRSSEQPLRLLLIRDKTGDLPWVVQTILQVMAPIELVQVRGLANGLWRLGRERFDSVLLDVDPRDRMAVDVCRRHIADVAAVPVLDLNNDEDVEHLNPTPRPRQAQRPAQPDQRPLREPWGDQRRPARSSRPKPAEESQEMVGRWPPKAGKRRVGRGRPAHLGGGLLGAD
ncbi:MAG: hypothetical protein R3349_10330 [Geminicoccaceae bacterium]|nr:hypothetical protein [Geminicoccaceae bacterium]